MDKESEFPKSKLGLIVIGLMGVAIGAWLWISSDNLESSINHNTAQNALNFRQAPYIGVEDKCSVFSSAQIDKCIFDKQETAREAQRKEYDLQAQQVAALWSRTTGQATIIAMAVGFLGIGLVFYTFWEAKRAANAGFAANKIAKDSSEQQLRAYLSWDGITMQFYREESGEVKNARFAISWKNSGQTPASKFIGDIEWKLTEGELPKNFDYPNSTLKFGEGLIVAPQAIVSTAADRLVTIGEFLSVANGQKKAFVWAWAEYIDAFKIQRRTEVAFEVEISELDDGGHDVSFNACGLHNGMDESCFKPIQTI